MIIFVNGKNIEIQNDTNIAALIIDLSLEEQRIAVEINTEIIPKSKYQLFLLKDGDKVEIIRAVGGG